MKKMTAKRSGHTKRKKLIAPEEPVIQKVDRFVYPREKEGVSKSGFSVT